MKLPSALRFPIDSLAQIMNTTESSKINQISKVQTTKKIIRNQIVRSFWKKRIHISFFEVFTYNVLNNLLREYEITKKIYHVLFKISAKKSLCDNGQITTHTPIHTYADTRAVFFFCPKGTYIISALRGAEIYCENLKTLPSFGVENLGLPQEGIKRGRMTKRCHHLIKKT